MTPQNLFIELKEVLEEVTKDVELKDLDGNRAKLNIFEQNVPKRETDEDDPFPYCIVRFVTGSFSSREVDDNSIRALLIFGLYDNGLDNTGEMVLSLFNRIAERFMKNNLLQSYYQEGKMEWAIDDEDTYPYFFAGMDMNFVPAMIIHREMFT